jgi:4-oxalocrotonate tautomerase
MPVVLIKLVKNALTAEQKQLMLHRVTDAVVSVEGEALRPGVSVLLEESVNDGEWSVGGNMLTIEAMNRMRRGESPWPDTAQE